MDNKLIDNQYEISTAIDEVAYYIDHKNLTKAMEVFSEDAQLEVYEDGKLTTLCKDKQQIQSVLTEKIENYDIIFHNNGTKMVDVKSLDQAATANTSCIAQLIRTDPMNMTLQTMEYEDSLIKVNGNWYIVKRVIRILYKSVRQKYYFGHSKRSDSFRKYSIDLKGFSEYLEILF